MAEWRTIHEVIATGIDESFAQLKRARIRRAASGRTAERD